MPLIEYRNKSNIESFGINGMLRIITSKQKSSEGKKRNQVFVIYSHPQIPDTISNIHQAEEHKGELFIRTSKEFPGSIIIDPDKKPASNFLTTDKDTIVQFHLSG